MAIANQNISSGTSSTTSLTVEHTCSVGTNRLLMVYVFNQSDTGTPPTDVTGVTYNGVSMTKADSIMNATNDATYAWYLVAPATGANDIVVTRADSTGSVLLGAIDYTGVDQSSPIDATDTTAAVSTTLTMNLTTVADNTWGTMGAYNADGGAVTESTNYTERNEPTTYSSSGDSDGTLITGATTMVATRPGGSSEFMGVAVSIAPSTTDSTLLTNLVSYWSLEEADDATRVDSAGSNDLNVANSVPQGTGADAKVGNSAVFTASSSDQLERTTPTGLDITSNLSINMWVKPVAINTNYALVDRYYDGSSRAYRLQADTTSARADFYLGATGGGSGTHHYSSANMFAAGTWVMLTAVFDDSANLVRFYKNGVAHGTSAKTDSIGSNSAALGIGVDAQFNNKYMDGSLDEIGIWDKVLSTTEITELYNSGDGLAYPFTGGGATFIPKIMII